MSDKPGIKPEAGMDECQRLLEMVDERRYDEALVRARMVLEKTDIGLRTRAKAHQLACWLYIEGLKKPCPEAALHGEEAARLYALLADANGECECRMGLISAYTQMCDFERAELAADRTGSILHDRPESVLYGPIMLPMSVAVIRLGQGRLEESLAALEQAEALCTNDDSRFLRHDIWRRRAYVLLKLRRVTEAAHWLDQVEEVEGAHRVTNWSKNLYRTTRGRLEVARGNWEAARSYIVNSLALARELQDFAVMAECCMLLAMIEEGEGRKDAWKRARSAVNYAVISGRRDVVRDVRENLKNLLAAEEEI